MMPEPSNIRVRIVGATDVGLVREHNEDSYLIIDLDNGEADFTHLREYELGGRGALLVVCDGMGGAAAGEVASQMAVQSMRQQLLPEPPASPTAPASDSGAAKATPPATEPPASTEPSSPEAKSSDNGEGEMHRVARRLREAAQRANQEIYEAACADIAKAGMGTTLTALMLLQTHVVVAQVGDSRAYLLRQGKLTQITHDQSLVNQLLDSGQITPEQAKLFEHSNVILQALGVQEDIEVVLSSEILRRDDRLLLCSDGLVGVVSDEEIQEVLNSAENLEDGVHRLIDMARAGGGPDNITVILAQSFGEGVPAPGPDEHALYRAMALDGDKPQERRTWSADYGYAGSASAGRDVGPSSASSGRFVSPVSLLSLSAVLALAVTGLVVGLVLYPQRPTMVPCRVISDQAGLQIMVDDKPAGVSALTSVELKLSPGEHRLWLSSSPDNVRRSGELLHTVHPGQQQCEIQLHTMSAAVNPPVAAATPDGAAADGGALPTGAVVRDGGEASADAAVEDEEPEPGQGGTETETGAPGQKKKHRRHRKPGEPVTPIQTGTGGTETPTATPDLASPGAAPTVPTGKPETKPLEPGPPEKTDKPATPDKPPEKTDKPATPDKPPATPEKPATAPAGDKPPAAPEKPAATPAVDKPVPGTDKPSTAPPTP